MDKEQALQDFLNSLKTALNNSAVYFPGHPIFIRSAEDLKKKVDSVLSFVNPLKISFSPKSLFVEAKTLDKAKLYEELAGFFHLRKIESLEMRSGLKNEELILFLSKVSLPAKEILRSGGLEGLLSKEKVSSISVKTLDYSSLLGSQGDEVQGKDIWLYLFQADSRNPPGANLDKLADNFAEVIENIRADDLLENEKLRENIHNFLGHLKDKNPEKFIKCSREMVKLILKGKGSAQEPVFLKLRIFFQDLHPEDLTQTLWEEIISDDNFDSLSFNLFSSLMDKKQNEEVASSLAQRISGDDSLKIRPKMMRKIKELFLSSDKNQQQEAYRGRLSGLLKDMILEETSVSDKSAGRIEENYRWLMLNLLAQEKNKSRLNLILEKISEEWQGIAGEKDWEFIIHILEVYRGRKEDIAFKVSFEPLKMRIAGFMEQACLEEEIVPELKPFLDALEKSSLSADYYLQKIFKENKSRPESLRLFFRFFPADLPVFIENIKKKSGDLEFLRGIMEGLPGIPAESALETLKSIFPFSHLLVKIEILKAMRKISLKDAKFLLFLLNEKDMAIRRESFLALADEPRERVKALKALLGIKSKKRIILENLNFIRETGLLIGAGPYLEKLAGRRFFWNKELRKAAKEALEELNAAKY